MCETQHIVQSDSSTNCRFPNRAEEGAAIRMQYMTGYGALIEQRHLAKGDYVLITAASSSVWLGKGGRIVFDPIGLSALRSGHQSRGTLGRSSPLYGIQSANR